MAKGRKGTKKNQDSADEQGQEPVVEREEAAQQVPDLSITPDILVPEKEDEVGTQDHHHQIPLKEVGEHLVPQLTEEVPVHHEEDASEHKGQTPSTQELQNESNASEENEKEKFNHPISPICAPKKIQKPEQPSEDVKIPLNQETEVVQILPEEDFPEGRTGTLQSNVSEQPTHSEVTTHCPADDVEPSSKQEDAGNTIYNTLYYSYLIVRLGYLFLMRHQHVL